MGLLDRLQMALGLRARPIPGDEPGPDHGPPPTLEEMKRAPAVDLEDVGQEDDAP